MFLARALLDNVAERPEELAFRRGDVVTVMMQVAGPQTPGGWWLCSFRGRQGIVPANRLKILSGLLMEEEEEEPSVDSSQQMGLEKTQTHSYQDRQSADCLQDYDVPPSRFLPSSSQPTTPAASLLYDTPPHLSAPSSNTSCHFHSSLNSFKTYDTPPPKKQPSSRSPWRSCTSIDNLVSTSFQALSVSGDQPEKLLQKAAPSRKRWSAESGSLMLSENGGVRMSRRDTGRLRFSGEIGNMKLPESKRQHIPQNSQPDFVRKMLPRDQTMYSILSYGQPEELAREGAYDIPNLLSRGLSRVCPETGTTGRRLHVSSSEFCISDISLPVSNHHRIIGATGLLGNAAPGTDISLGKSTQSRPSHRLSLNAGMESGHSIPASCPLFPSSAGTLRPLSDSFAGDSLYNSKTDHNLEKALNGHHRSVSTVNLKPTKSDCYSASAASYHPWPVYDVPPQVTRHSRTSASSNCSVESFRLSSGSMDSTSSGTADFYCLAEGMYEELQLDKDSAVKLLMKLQEDVTRSASQVIMSVSSSWHTQRCSESSLCDINAACMELKKTVTQLIEFAQGALVSSSDLSDRKLVGQFVKQVNVLHGQLKAISETLISLENMQWQVLTLPKPLKPDLRDHLDRIICLTKDLTPEVAKLVSFVNANDSLLLKRSSGITTLPNCVQTVHESSTPSLHQSEAGIPRTGYVQSRPLPPLPVSMPGKQLCSASLVQTHPSRQVTSCQNNLNDKVMTMQESTRWCNMADSHNDNGENQSYVQDEYDYVQLEASDSGTQEKSWHQQKRTEKKRHSLKNIAEEPECSDTLMTGTNQNCVVAEKKANTKTRAKIMSQLIHHTEKVFAYLGTKHPNTDKVQTKEMSRSISVCKSHPNGLLKPVVHFQELSTNTCNMTRSKTPIHRPLSDGFCVTIKTLDAGDKQVLCYYTGQLESHYTLLTNAVDVFMVCIQDKEPPRVFVSNSKFVIVTAYKLIYMADALLRRLVNVELRDQVSRCAGQGCECLKVCVQATKTAVLQYPSVTAVQHMVDRVVDVLHAAHELRLLITQAAAL